MRSRVRYFFIMLQFLFTVTTTIVIMYIFKKHNHKIRQTWGQLQLKILGIKLEFEGQLDQTAQMVVFNHQSILDIIIFEALYPKNLAWVAKKQIADLPFLGQILKIPDMIIIDRENKAGLVKLIKQTKQHLNNGRPIAIFPEGTRSDGKKMLKFKMGAKIIAEKHNTKIQPILIIGSRNCIDSQQLKAKKATVSIVYLPAVYAKKSENWYKELEQNMNYEFNKRIKKYEIYI
ncbi:MAG: 1-acyl-sn-glycerol-3-phosphate acyltransferase [Epsilonproteobacteria bacterium]|nr:MAG: 1-acyl-sn-glycerol-3-phosphate acyltransferase [Campylobacterota bacterium]